MNKMNREQRSAFSAYNRRTPTPEQRSVMNAYFRERKRKRKTPEYWHARAKDALVNIYPTLLNSARDDKQVLLEHIRNALDAIYAVESALSD